MAIWIGERPDNIAWNDFKAAFITQYDRYPTFTNKKEALRRMQRTHNQTYQQFYDKFKNRLKTMVPNGEITAEVRQQYSDEFAQGLGTAEFQYLMANYKSGNAFEQDLRELSDYASKNLRVGRNQPRLSIVWDGPIRIRMRRMRQPVVARPTATILHLHHLNQTLVSLQLYKRLVNGLMPWMTSSIRPLNSSKAFRSRCRIAPNPSHPTVVLRPNAIIPSCRWP